MGTSVTPVSGYANKFALFVAFSFAGRSIEVPVRTTRPHNMTLIPPNITTGPWHIGKRAGAEHGAIYGEKGEEIALPLGFFMEASEAKANARAIAALPELLAALERIHANAAESPEWIRRHTCAALEKAGYTFAD